MNISIHHSETICNSLKKNNFYEILSESERNYIPSVLLAMFSSDYHGKTLDFEQYSDYHRTSISRFLRSEALDEMSLSCGIRRETVTRIYEESRISGKPVLCIVDDTIASKAVPSSEAEHPIESAYFHYSHLKGKADYGHQAVCILLSCNGITLPYAVILYDKSVSKIEIVKQTAQELPVPPQKSYLLCDCWYVSGELLDAFAAKGFYTIGALKTNRCVYPYGVKMNIHDFAEKLKESDGRELFHYVTVKGRKYLVYRYEGHLNGIENAVVLLTYPAGAFGKEKTLRAFISTDISLSDEEILDFYAQRWDIEVFFRTVKSRFAFAKCQIRSAKAVQRVWILLELAYFLACSASDKFHFLSGLSIMVHQIEKEQYSHLYDIAVSSKDKSSFLALAC